MNLTNIDGKVAAYFLAFLIVGYILNLCSYTYYENATSSDYEYNWLEEGHLRRVRTYLRENGWVDERVSEDELDYICLLTKQLTTYYDNLPWPLALSLIAQESKFYQYDEYEGALGLMQLLPSYHSERLIQCLEEDERYSQDLFFEPRLNVMAGLDYLSQLIDECDEDIPYALMCYNQGPSSAHRIYEQNGIVSDYANNIMNLCSALEVVR